MAAAAAAAFVLVSWQREEERCTDAGSRLLSSVRADAPDRVLDESIGAIVEECQGSLDLVAVAGFLVEVGEAERAEAVAREAVRREPQNFSAWAALASILREADPAESRRAGERASELNSRYRPPS